MLVELLVVTDCANEQAAHRVLREAAKATGITDLDVTVHVIDTDAAARHYDFVGSPTFLLDGIDLFPHQRAPVGLACRVYPGACGPSGVPDITALGDALLRARACRASAAGAQ